jgi:flagellar biosynthesis protein FlhF
MRLDAFRGASWSSVFAAARRAIGDDVMIVRTRTERGADGATFIEVLAASARDLDRFRRRLEPTPLRADRARRGQPYVVALVGPTGAGKTTTIAKLAVHPEAFGGRRVGLVSLDTYRAGALEQLQGYADVAGLPLEVVYDARDVEAARRRLADCDVILVDTPGRSPRAHPLEHAWRQLLAAWRPDEIHLALPATMRHDLAAGVLAAYAATAPTHLLVTKCDEIPDDAGLAELALALDLPMRWLTDGQDVPTDLHVGGGRVLDSLGRLSAAAPTLSPSAA